MWWFLGQQRPAGEGAAMSALQKQKKSGCCAG